MKNVESEVNVCVNVTYFYCSQIVNMKNIESDVNVCVNVTYILLFSNTKYEKY
jgi:hypothetical protein